MHTARPYPGKFEGNESQLVAEVVYNKTLDGIAESIGDVEGFGFYAFVKGKRYGFIMSEDSQGFVTVVTCLLAEAEQKWADLEHEYSDYCVTYPEV